ncbi:hypothetical protein [Streptomyces sp. NPDC056817]|uniref:hypothetical protein n=1 Tax=Streptomyces sp. NPDC056817 TaxID=3345950 RepID=UPI0036B21FA0
MQRITAPTGWQQNRSVYDNERPGHCDIPQLVYGWTEEHNQLLDQWKAKADDCMNDQAASEWRALIALVRSKLIAAGKLPK